MELEFHDPSYIQIEILLHQSFRYLVHELSPTLQEPADIDQTMISHLTPEPQYIEQLLVAWSLSCADYRLPPLPKPPRTWTIEFGILSTFQSLNNSENHFMSRLNAIRNQRSNEFVNGSDLLLLQYFVLPSNFLRRRLFTFLLNCKE